MSATVLVIDDAPEVHALLAARLRAEGVLLLSALDWAEGRELAMTKAPDLILLDVEMPGFSGLDLCRLLKSDPRTSSIPIIFLTGATDVSTKVHGFDLGAVDYVTKPFHPAELRARVRSALRTKRYQDLLAAKAQVDALTGLRNRGYFDEFLAAAVRSAHAESRPCSLVLVDLDHFKQLNDRFGHPFGDLVLQRVGEIVNASVRVGEAACRYGGEEMALILPNTPVRAAVVVADRVRTAISAIELSPRGERVLVTASFGVAETGRSGRAGHGASAAALVVAADAALYRAKQHGRDRVCAVSASGTDHLAA